MSFYYKTKFPDIRKNTLLESTCIKEVVRRIVRARVDSPEEVDIKKIDRSIG